MSNLGGLIMMFSMIYNPMVPTWKKVAIIVTPIVIVVTLMLIIQSLKKEKFIGTDMHHYGGFSKNLKSTNQERLAHLQKIQKGYLPGKDDEVLENFTNSIELYHPDRYAVRPDYHRKVQVIGSNPNPVESLETPEFMIPKSYNTEFKFENIAEVGDNEIEASKLRAIESTFKVVEQNKFYKDLLKSKCRAGNRSDYKNCGCSAPQFGEH